MEALMVPAGYHVVDGGLVLHLGPLAATSGRRLRSSSR
jgi:hypothetical protein